MFLPIARLLVGTFLFGGQSGIIARIVYVLVALAALWCISLLFRDTTEAGDRDYRPSET